MVVSFTSKINPYTVRNYCSRKANQVTDFVLNKLGSKENPTITVTNPKTLDKIEWIGKNLSSAENRLILGGSALLSQPFIDAANKDVDEKTRKYSIARTVAKIIAGTVTGYSIRKLCIKSIDAFTTLPEKIKPDTKFKKLRTCLLPSMKMMTDEMAQYKNTLGTLAALGVMVFTNFLIDAPLTKFLTNLLTNEKGVENAKSK